jgi:hypothetical protein
MDDCEISGVVFILGGCFGYRLLWRECVRRWKLTTARLNDCITTMETCVDVMDDEPARNWLVDALERNR